MMTINDADFLRLVQFVRSNFGINLEHKRQLIDARLAFDIKRRGYGGFSEYVSYIITHTQSDECKRMINRLSTNYTFFFRESDYIDKLCGKVLDDFTARDVRNMRIWCAACSSGEEAYSVAMALDAHIKLLHIPMDFEIIGTDINTEMLQLAQSGRYANDAMAQIPEKYRHYTAAHTTQTFEISNEIKGRVKWQYKNLLDSPDECDKYDIIFCRNVMIYFTPDLRREMTAKLYTTLVHGGYLFTGATESIDLERKYFCYIAPTFYQKS